MAADPNGSDHVDAPMPLKAGSFGCTWFSTL
jgi:hypothetical protein